MNASKEVETTNRRRIAVTVERVLDIAPFLRRITVRGPGLNDFFAPLPAQWVKVFVPQIDQAGPPGRAYTIKAIRQEPASMDLDFVIHEHGLCSTWATEAKPNDVIEIAGPRAGFRLASSTRHLLLGGDETALPAISSILGVLPENIEADAYIEIPGHSAPSELTRRANCRVTWLGRGENPAGTSGALQDAVMKAKLPSEGSEVWFAAEASVTQQIRQHFGSLGSHRPVLTAVGYWKRGVTDHRERHAP